MIKVSVSYNIDIKCFMILSLASKELDPCFEMKIPQIFGIPVRSSLQDNGDLSIASLLLKYL